MYHHMALNLEELGKIVREMQAQSTADYKKANNFNEVGAEIVQLGVDDKMKSKGWPVGTVAPVSEKKVF
jgi:hypothetical protein